MSKISLYLSIAAVWLTPGLGLAQPAPPQAPNMTFFVTSAGVGKGADLGGLEGADTQCQTLATSGACSHISGQVSSRARYEVAIRFNRFHRPAL